jgi:alkylation response protein AidB-like acyl-CoA dehydrogenase
VDGDDFLQDPPRLSNTFEADAPLRHTLERLLPADLHARLAGEWRALGEAAARELPALAREAERDAPRHVPFDAWGRRVDEVHVSPAWTALKRRAAAWGLAALPYERGLGPFARLHQFALLHLFAPSSAVYTCYLARTDGAARTLLEHAGPALRERAVPRLTSRDPDAAWTSGQWMTERTGGSDVGGSLTRAAQGTDGTWRLWGAKWFTSAITSEMTLTLARPEGAAEGSAGLSLFYLEPRDADGRPNGLRVLRLKEKLGTRALPTAELELAGAAALPVGDLGHGVRKIAPLLNVTRLHNAVNAAATMARLLHLLRDYARRRRVFGAALADKPLHRATTAELAVDYEAALALTFECARLLGRQEAGEASLAEAAVLRLVTPLAKLATAKQAVAVASEALEGFGGAGYVEDTGLPVHLRDAQVLPIWEGTTDVLSLDVLRVLDAGGLPPWAEDARARLEALRGGPAEEAAGAAARHLDETLRFAQAARRGEPFREAGARALARRLAWIAAAVPLCEQAAWAASSGRGTRALAAATRWQGRLPPLPDPACAGTWLAEADVLAEGA